MAGTHPIDGSLPAWEDVADEADWKVLLLGNGLSVNVWGDFAYGSLDWKQSAINLRLDVFDDYPQGD